MNYTEQRQYYRSLLNGTACVSPASVYDPLSARVAESVGYRLAILAGSVASQTTIAAPDIVLLTLTELADQVRRIMRTSTLSLMVDADHGFGNALNVMRTVQELEHAGAAACSIEDTVLPASYGAPTDSEELISTEEMVGKLRAALAARTDPTFVVLGRTSALRAGDTEGAIARAKAYAATGVDAIFLVGARSLDQIAAVHQASGLPVVIGAAPASLTRAEHSGARRAHPAPGPPAHLRGGEGAAIHLPAPLRRRRARRPARPHRVRRRDGRPHQQRVPQSRPASLPRRRSSGAGVATSISTVFNTHATTYSG